MKVVIQRVNEAKCIIDNEVYSKIPKGLLLLVGFGKDDCESDLDWYVKKIVNMRIFEDKEGKMNLSVLDIDGEILSISQFTLYGDCIKGNRPSFTNSLNPTDATRLFDLFNQKLKDEIKTETGVFAADMKLDFVNDGPVTIILEK